MAQPLDLQVVHRMFAWRPRGRFDANGEPSLAWVEIDSLHEPRGLDAKGRLKPTHRVRQSAVPRVKGPPTLPHRPAKDGGRLTVGEIEGLVVRSAGHAVRDAYVIANAAFAHDRRFMLACDGFAAASFTGVIAIRELEFASTPGRRRPSRFFAPRLLSPRWLNGS